MTDGKFDLQKLKVASPCYEQWDQMKGGKVYPPPSFTMGAVRAP
jgi:hypothetical protein